MSFHLIPTSDLVTRVVRLAAAAEELQIEKRKGVLTAAIDRLKSEEEKLRKRAF